MPDEDDEFLLHAMEQFDKNTASDIMDYKDDKLVMDSIDKFEYSVRIEL